MTSTTTLATTGLDRIYGTRPAHEHRSDSGKKWLCNSPYCEEMAVPHPSEPGGMEPIIQGREPWKGR
jgi:hypothetical protein